MDRSSGFSRRIIAPAITPTVGAIVIRCLVLALWLGLPLGPGTGVAWAHGGGVPQLTNAEAGPYWVSVWTQPDPLQTGQAHVTVAVSQPVGGGGDQREAGPPVLGAQVQVAFQPLEGGAEPVTASATHENAANKLLYETDLTLADTGRWQVIVTVDSTEGSGSASFEVEVVARRVSPWRWIGGAAVLAIAAVWVVQKMRSERDQDADGAG